MEVLVLLLVLVVPVVIAFVVRHEKAVNTEWEKAARTLHLRFQPAALFTQRSMRGEVDGVRVTVEVHRSGGKNSKVSTRFIARHRRRPPDGLRLKREGAMARLAKMVGAQDVQTGDETFDDAVLVKAKDERGAQAWLTPPRRHLVQAYLRRHAEAVVGEQDVTWPMPGTAKRASLLVNETRNLVEFVLALEAKGEPAEAMAATAPEPPVADPPPLAVGDPADEQRVAERQPPPLPGEDDGHAAEGQGAEMPAPEPAPEQPSEPEPEPEPTLEAEPEPEPEAPPTGEPAAEPATTPGDATGLTAAVVCGELLGGSSSIEAGRTFDERYAGRVVRWTGRLRSSQAFTFDFVFGDRRGTKATFETHLLETTSYSEKWALAVVALPPEQHAELRDRAGETFTFEGTLQKVETFSNTLYLGDGQLIG